MPKFVVILVDILCPIGARFDECKNGGHVNAKMGRQICTKTGGNIGAKMVCTFVLKLLGIFVPDPM